MKLKPTKGRRKFADPWDEIGHLYDKLLYWLYQRAEVEKSRHFADRLEVLLSSVNAGHQGIFAEECWSLLYEAKGDLPSSIKHRQNEIRLIRRVQAICRGTPHEELVLKQCGHAELSDRLDLLGVLYHENGNLDKAITVLNESKQLSALRGLRFDGEEILREYLEERKDSCTFKNGRE
jgi:tetratricopeptide (TPR) repeat protein